MKRDTEDFFKPGLHCFTSDVAPRRSVFGGVVEEVEEHLLEEDGIELEIRQVFGEIDRDGMARGHSLGTLQRAPHHIGEIGQFGARFDRAMALGPASVLMLRARLGYAHDWVRDPTAAAVFQALPGANFVVNGAAPAHDSGLASAGAELRFANGIAFGAKFDGEFAARSQTYTGTGTVRYTW